MFWGAHPLAQTPSANYPKEMVLGSNLSQIIKAMLIFIIDTFTIKIFKKPHQFEAQ